MRGARIDFEQELVKLATGMALKVGIEGVRSYLSRNPDVLDSTIRIVREQFPDIEGTETALRQWTTTNVFSSLFDEVYEGKRAAADEFVTSLIDDGGFYLPSEHACWQKAKDIVSAFIRVLSGEIYRTSEGLGAHANRQEELHIETRQDVAERFSALEAKLPSLLAGLLPGGSGTETKASLESHSEVVAKIGTARDLIRRGHIRSAHLILEELGDVSKTLPEELQARIKNNLASCAMAEGDMESACRLIDEAFLLQPESHDAIGNSALAAQLREDSVRAIELATKARELKPQHSQGTAILMAELWASDKGQELEELVKREEWIRQDRQCCLVLGSIRSHQRQFLEAVEIYRSLVADDTEDVEAQIALGQCLLSYVQDELMHSHTAEECFGLIQEAESCTSVAIGVLGATDLKRELCDALVCRAASRALMRANLEAMSDLDSVLRENPTHVDALRNKGLLLLNEGRPEEARTVLEKLQDSEAHDDTDLLLADAYLGSGDTGAVINLLKETVNLESPSRANVHRIELLCRAEWEAGHELTLEADIWEALERQPNNPRLLSLKAMCHELHGQHEKAEGALLDALDHADDSQQRELTLRRGYLYYSLERYGEAADQLDEAVEEDPLHPAATLLLVCLVNSQRLRNALDWARKLRGSRGQVDRVVLQVESQVLGYAGDVGASIVCLQELCSRSDSTEADRVKLALAQFRINESDAARQTIRNIDVSKLRKDPSSLLTLAQLKLFLGEPDYLEDAYFAHQCGTDDPDVQLGYFQMFVARDKGWIEPETIVPGCAVFLKSDSSEQWWKILDAGEERVTNHEIDASDSLAQRLSGKRVGDTLVLREGLEDLSYEIVVIQSKFVRAFQEISDEFSTRFPEHMGLFRVNIEDDDYSKLFIMVERRDERAREIERMYTEERLPFATFCSQMGRSVPEVWRACTLGGLTSIQCGRGSEDDASSASDLLRNSNEIVLDTLALLTIFELGLSELLRSRFARVTVPQHVIDELQQAHAYMLMSSTPTSWLGKTSDGRYTLLEISADDGAKWQEFVTAILVFAESFERVPSYPLLKAEEADKLVNALTRAGAGTIYAGDDVNETPLVLVSDDLFLAEFARLVGIGSVNTQAILGELLRSNVITADAYSQWIERLALLNYRLVSVSVEDIARRLGASGYITTDGTRAMLRTLQGPYCSEVSAASVAAGVVASLVGTVPLPQIQMILSVLIAELRSGRVMSTVMERFRSELMARLAHAPLYREQILKTVDLHILRS